MSSDSEEEADLNLLDFNDPVVIHTLRMTMMEIMENEHTEKPLQQSRSRTSLRGTHTIRSISYPYRKHSKSRDDTTRGRILPRLEEQPEEELRQMGESLLGNYLLDYARRRVYICLSTSIVRNNYFIFKQAMHKDLHLNDRSADKLRRIWDEARSEYHKGLVQESSTPTQQGEAASGSHSQQTRSTEVTPATAGHAKSKIPTLRSSSKQATERTKPATTPTSTEDKNIPTDTAIIKSSEKKLDSARGSTIFESVLDKVDRRIESDFWYPETKLIYEYKPSTSTKAKVNTLETSKGHVSAEGKSDKADFNSSPESAKMNPEEQESSGPKLASPEQKDGSAISDICQGLASLQINDEPKQKQTGTKKKVPEASSPSCSGMQRDYEKYAMKGDGSSDGLESLLFKSKAKPKKKKKRKKSASSSSISTDEDIRYKKQETSKSSDSEERAGKLVELFREKRRQPGQLLQPPSRVTSKQVQDAEKKTVKLLYLEDVYHYPRRTEKKLTDEQYEKRVREARKGRQLREYLQEVEKERKILQQQLAEQFKLLPKQTTGKQKPTAKHRQSRSPQPRLFLGEIEYPPPFQMYNLNVRRPQITPAYIGTCEYCRMMFGGQPPIKQTRAQAFRDQQSVEQSRRRILARLDPFLIPPARRRELSKEIEEEQKKKIELQQQRAREREARIKEAKLRTDPEQYKKDLRHGLLRKLEKKLPVGLKPAKPRDEYPGSSRRAVSPELRQLSPNKEFHKRSEAEGVTHMVSPPRSIMRPAWFPEKIPFAHQPHHIDNPPLQPWFQKRK